MLQNVLMGRVRCQMGSVVVVIVAIIATSIVLVWVIKIFKKSSVIGLDRLGRCGIFCSIEIGIVLVADCWSERGLWRGRLL